MLKSPLASVLKQYFTPPPLKNGAAIYVQPRMYNAMSCSGLWAQIMCMTLKSLLTVHTANIFTATVIFV